MNEWLAPMFEKDRLTFQFKNALDHLIIAIRDYQVVWAKDLRFGKNRRDANNKRSTWTSAELLVNRLFFEALEYQFDVGITENPTREQLIKERDLAKEQYAEIWKLLSVTLAGKSQLEKGLRAACKHTSPLGTDIDAEVAYWVARGLADEAGEAYMLENSK